ncbi:MAG: UbiA prenyltransferase family protein [bacterium]|nr:UbiA prenyltransferase family protein [bacterium]
MKHVVVAQKNAWIVLLRPHQWFKNLLVFAALLFSQHYVYPSDWLATLLTFIAFCLASSSIYIFNDWVDRTSDQQHPTKKHRPLASGVIPVIQAVFLAILLMLISLGLGFFVNLKVVLVLLGYIGLMIFYTLFFKHVLLLDLIVLSVGIILRAMIGAIAISVTISHWLLVCMFFLAMMLVCAKRRSEIQLLNNIPFEPRTSLLATPAMTIWDMWGIGFGIITMLAYALYTVDSQTIEKVGSIGMIYTLPMVILGILRFQYLVFTQNEGEDTAKTILKDPFLMLVIAIWLLISYLVIAFQ